MKRIFCLLLLIIGISPEQVFAQDNFLVPTKIETTPVTYLQELKIYDVNRALNSKEKNDICRLFSWGYKTSKKKYNQDYVLRLDTPVYKLFKKNFPSISPKFEHGREGIFLRQIYEYIKLLPRTNKPNRKEN